MKLEFKLALVGAISKIVIFLFLLVLIEQFFDTVAVKHTDKDLVAMKKKTMAIIDKIGIGSFLTGEKDSAYASYNILKDEFISLRLTPNAVPGITYFETVPRIIEEEEFDFRTLTNTVEIAKQCYTLEIGKNIQIVSGFNQTIQRVAISTILLVLIVTILFDLGIYKFLLRPLNRFLIPKLKTTTNPETFDYSELKTSTDDFNYLNQTINELMMKVNTIMSTQKRFIADVSHELITPISVIQSKIENLSQTENLSNETQSSLTDMLTQLNRLQQIIKALLLISKIENDQYPKNESFYIRELIGEIISDIEDRAMIREITIENSVDEKIEFVNVNRNLIYIMIFNLVSNAIKYNREGGFVKITGCYNKDQCQISVSDNGIGIDQEQIPLIFDRFKRVGNKNSRGFGLGLSIVKTIAQYHDAQIDVVSKIDEGSVFNISFPLKYLKIKCSV